jgi:hypothetical protein
MRKLLIASVCVAGWAVAACQSEEPDAVEQYKVAEATIAGGVKLEVLAMPDGSFITSQSGGRGTAPVQLDARFAQVTDPAVLWRQLAPGQPIPAGLKAALARAGRTSDQAEQPGLPASGLSPETASTRLTPEATPIHMQGRGGNFSNWTGTGDCTKEWFTDNGMCPGNARNQFCAFYVPWAFIEHPSVDGGSGAVCAHSGQLTFKVTGSESSGVTGTFTVDQGSWRKVVFIGPVGGRTFWRFEMVPRPDGSFGQFGGELTRN